MTHSTSAKLPREIATKILDRAASLDGTDERIDLATLRSAAMDAGISPDAFERALVESMSVAPQRTRALTLVGVLAGVFTYLKAEGVVMSRLDLRRL